MRAEDIAIDWMKANDIPVTRENYIDVVYMGTPPTPWTAEDEAMLPSSLQNWNGFSVSGRDLEYIW